MLFRSLDKPTEQKPKNPIGRPPNPPSGGGGGNPPNDPPSGGGGGGNPPNNPPPPPPGGGLRAPRPRPNSRIKPVSVRDITNVKALPSSTRKALPPAGGTKPKAKTLGQRARQNPKIRAGLIQQRMGEGYSDWRNELILEKNLIIEIDDKKSKQDDKEKIIDVMKGENKIDLNPKIDEAYKDDEGGMAKNELSTIEKSVKSLRKKIKSETQQLPAWVQSKISKAADYIDTVADYMDGNPEPVKEAHEDETFRQHSRETFSSYKPSETRKRTAGVLKLKIGRAHV